MGKQLGWAHKLGAEESLRISKASQIVLARLMESQIWHQLTGSVGEEFNNRQWPLLTLMPDTSVSPCIPSVLSRGYPGAGAQRELVWVGESVCVFFKRNCFGSSSVFHWLNSPWFLQPGVAGTYLSGTGTMAYWAWRGAGTTHSWDIPPEFLSTTHGKGPAGSVYVLLLPVWMDVVL